MIVKNRFPTLQSHLRLAVIGECPSKVESEEGEPLVGKVGDFVGRLLSRSGISKEACFLGNLAQDRAPNGDFSSFDWNDNIVQSGLLQLDIDLKAFKPNIILALGNAPLHWLKVGNVAPKKVKKKGLFVFKWPYSVFNWRGSIFQSQYGKAISTLLPAYVLRDYSTSPLLQFDIRRAVSEAKTNTIVLPERKINACPSFSDVTSFLLALHANPRLVAIDIEGGVYGMSCISFADQTNNAIIVPFFRKDGTSYWNQDEEAIILRLLATVLENPVVPKVLQNSLYDRFVLAWAYGIRVFGTQDDTMLKHWEKFSELPKDLGTQASIYTMEPYYKQDRKSNSDDTFYRYCCLDSAVTYEINKVLEPKIIGSPRVHYTFNVNLLNALLYMELRGTEYNSVEAAQRRAAINIERYKLQAKINTLSGRGLTKQITRDELRRLSIDRFVMKKFRKLADKVDESMKAFCYTSDSNTAHGNLSDYAQYLVCLCQPNPDLATLGQIEDLLGLSLNIESHKQFTQYLYEEQSLPKQFDTSKDPPTLSANYEALLNLSKKTTHPVPKVAIELRSLLTRQQMLSISADRDGRIRCGYNIVGSETGRVTCYESPTGSGYNLQTIPKCDRDLFVADDGFWYFQCDLAGADGWTVAAYCKMLGDSNMLDDYMFGIKPAKIIALALRGTKCDFSNRESLRAASKTVSSEDWDYFACKRIQHGTSYLEGARTTCEQIYTDSEGKFYMEEKEVKKLQYWLKEERYVGIPRWHDWVGRKLRDNPMLTAASGQQRIFFGRRDEILPKAVAFEPQANTTYATNLAMQNLWNDPENRTTGETIPFHVEPLHQVHDALNGQFRKEKTEWSTRKIKSWFNNPLTIAGQQITIPYDGGYGRNWYEAGSEEKRVGKI